MEAGSSFEVSSEDEFVPLATTSDVSCAKVATESPMMRAAMIAAMTQNGVRMLHRWRIGHLHNCDMGSRRITGRLCDIPVLLSQLPRGNSLRTQAKQPRQLVSMRISRLHRILRHLAAGAIGAQRSARWPRNPGGEKPRR